MAEETSGAGNVDVVRQERAQKLAAANLAQSKILIDPTGVQGEIEWPHTAVGQDILRRSLKTIGISPEDVRQYQDGRLQSIKSLDQIAEGESILLTQSALQKLSEAGVNHPVVNAYRGKPPFMGRGQG